MPVFKRKVGIMKLIMENWRDYQKQTIEEQQLLTEGAIWDAIKNGFSKLVDFPEKFNQMVEKTKENLQKNLKQSLAELAKEPEMVEIGKEIASKVNNSPLTEGATSPEQVFSISQLQKMGVSDDVLNKIKETVSATTANSIIKSAEEVIGKSAPPKVKDFLARFLSKFIGSFIFGFIDNFVMVIAGNFIDKGLAVMLGGFGGAMFAAGLGNTISDIVGELGSTSIEGAMDKMGLDPEKVTDAEMENAPKWMKLLDKRASVIGIALGCLAGLFPLAFMEEVDREVQIPQ